MPLEGREVKSPWSGNWTNVHVAEQLGQWSEAIGCHKVPKLVSDQESVQKMVYPCKGTEPRLTVMYLQGHGYQWPGGKQLLPSAMIGPVTSKLNATEVIWDLFKSAQTDAIDHGQTQFATVVALQMFPPPTTSQFGQRDVCSASRLKVACPNPFNSQKENAVSASPHAVNWFEIPVSDFARAKAFYEAILGISIEPMEMGPITMGFLTSDPNAVGGAIVHGEGCTPSAQGTIVYLNGGDDLAPMLARAASSGGSLVVAKTDIGNGFGFFAHFMDTEGNKIGLHSMG